MPLGVFLVFIWPNTRLSICSVEVVETRNLEKKKKKKKKKKWTN